MKVAISTTTVALSAAALILLPSAPVQADAAQARWQQVFNQLDQDRDGLLSREEYERAASLLGSAKPQTQADKSAQSAIQSPGSQQAQASQQGQSDSSQQAMGSPQGQIGAVGMQIPYLVLIPNPSHMNQAGHTGSQVPYLHPFSMPQTAQSATWQSQPYWAYTGGNPMQVAQGSFDALDSDRNGYLSVFEAFRHSPLLQAWSTVDANRDGVIERTEFSAFEARGGR